QGQPRALFRMIGADGIFNYHDFMLTRFPDGVGMKDAYIYVSGETFSQSLRRLFLPALARGEQGVRLKGRDDDYVQGALKLGEVNQAVQQRQFARAAALYRGLPHKLQEDKCLQLAYMQWLRQLGENSEKDFLAAVEKFRKLYPDGAAVDFMSIDYYF